MRLAYFGTAPFAVPALEKLAPHVVLVVSQPDRPSGRGMKLQPSPVKAKAEELGIPVQTPEKARDPEFVEFLKTLDCDAFVVAAYGQILPKRILDIPKQGCINLHGSILPQWRGAAPIQRGVEAGDTVSGVTLMQMDKGMDTGDIIAIETTGIGPDETAGELYNRLAVIAGDLAEAWLPLIVKGNYPRTPQNDEEATLAPKVNKEDARLDFTESLTTNYNRFRAFTPAPGAYLETNLGKLKIHKARAVTDQSGEPGEVLATRPNLIVAFADGALDLVEVQAEGRKRVSGEDFANGAQLAVGARLL